MDTTEVFGPKHHGGTDDPFETIKVLEAWLTPDEMIGFCKGQSIVYQRRHRAKGGLTDLAKSAWYQSYLVKYLAARNLSGYGETSVPPLKSEPSTVNQPDPPPARPTAVYDTAGAALVPEPLQTAETGPGATPAAEVMVSATERGTIEDDIASFAQRFAPDRSAAA